MHAICKPSNPYEYNDYYENYSQVIGQETAVLVVAHNRPHYLKECIKAIEKNPESQLWTFIFALDGGPHAKQAENSELIKNSSIKNTIILTRPYNYGCPKNHIDAKRFAFDWCKFKQLIVLEDDVLVTPTYFAFIMNFYVWATRTYSNIGVVQGWTYCHLSLNEKRKQLNMVKENPLYWSFLTYCIDSDVWDKIKTILYTFEEFIDQIPRESFKERSKPFHWKDMPKIRKWVHALAKEKIFDKAHDSRHLQSKFRDGFKQSFLKPDFLAAQDVMMGFALFMHDLVKLHSLVNRAIHIGVNGITSTANHFYANKLDKIMLDTFDEDKDMQNFKLA